MYCMVLSAAYYTEHLSLAPTAAPQAYLPAAMGERSVVSPSIAQWCYPTE
jgi:hypothetical protein